MVAKGDDPFLLVAFLKGRSVYFREGVMRAHQVEKSWKSLGTPPMPPPPRK